MAVLVAGALSAPAAVSAQSLPQYVRGPLSGLVHDCKVERQQAPAAEAYISIGELDGDG
jgi:hypothetical protein